MTTIAHISDLHFGVAVPSVVEGLARHLIEHPPSLLVVSGDLTQRARAGQFAEARKFLDRFPWPRLVIPGNHDVPLYDVVRRFSSPLGRYREQIQEELNPLFQNDEVLVAGVNTARSLTWKSGRISHAQMDQLAKRLAQGGARLKVVVTHHPFIPSPLSPKAGIDLGRAAQALTILEQHKVDLLLAGHLHHGYAGDTRTHFASATRSIISVQAGTAVSRRVRREPNAFNWITVQPDTLLIQMLAWDGRGFQPAKRTRYRKRDGAWLPEPA
ncbi:hypothetical protein DB347_22185 [Opitutaceae bacterium EW11]|nr:hypothetical protein DB347_22185 [Opitutaceae bacterium EW11]